jgi:hypothetical protein
MMAAHNNNTPPRIVGVPDDLADLIDWMMAKDPAVRPSIEAVQRDLRALAPSVSAEMTPEAVDRPDDSEATLPPMPLPVESGNGPSTETLSGGTSAAMDAARRAESGPVLPLAGAADVWAANDTGPPASPVVATPAAAAASVPDVGLDAAAAAGPLGGPTTPMGQPLAAPAAQPMSEAAAPVEPEPLVGAGVSGNGATPLGAYRAQPPSSNDLPTWWRAAAVGTVFAALIGFAAVLLANQGDDVDASGQDPAAPATEDEGGAGDGAGSEGGSDGGEGGGPSATLDLLNSTSSSTTSSTTSTSVLVTTPATGSSTSTNDASSTTSSSTTSTTQSTTSSSTTSTSRPTSSTTRPTTSSTRPTTSSTRPTTSSTRPTTSTTPASERVVWESEPTISNITENSFRVDFETNTVCGTATATVFDDTEMMLSYEQGEGCFGPRYRFTPGLQARLGGDFDLEPSTTYRLRIVVTGTKASTDDETTGTGTLVKNLNVTTADDPNDRVPVPVTGG